MLNAFYESNKAETVVNALEEWSAQMPNQTALISKEREITYGSLFDEVQILSGYLRTIGIKNGSCVLLEAASSIEYLEVYLALQLTAAITAPVERGIKSDKLEYLLRLTNADLYVFRTESSCTCCKSLSYEEIMKEAFIWNIRYSGSVREWKESAEIIFTTGTTGKSKAAVHTLMNLYANTVNTVQGMEMTSDDRVLIPLPLNHSFGMRVVRAVIKVGGCAVLLNGSVFAKSILDAVNKYQCTGLVCVAATMDSIRREVGDEILSKRLGNLRYVEFSAGAASPDLRKAMLKLLPETQIHNTWGSSETGGCVFINVKENPEKIDALGKAPDSVILEIWSEEKNDFVDGTGKDNAGKLAIYGDMVFSGYLNQENLYRETVKDGWMITNDLVWRDEDHFLHMLGRSDDMINVGGEKVSPAEIENLADELEPIADSACVGVADEEGILGQIPVLFYTLEEGEIISEKVIREMFIRRLGSMKAPKYLIQVDEIPRNYMKKKNYRELKEKVWEEYRKKLA